MCAPTTPSGSPASRSSASGGLTLSLPEVIIIGLAGWRLAALAVYERGPGDAAVKLREAAGFEHDAEGLPIGRPATFLGGLLSCVWCLGLWLVVPLWLLYQVLPMAVGLLAAAAVVVAAERWNHG